MSKLKFLAFPLIFSAILFVSLLSWLGNGRSTQAAPLATTWYVNAATGSNGNSCLSAGSACATIAGAMGKAGLDDIIEIAAGTYHENLAGSLIVQDLTLNGAGVGSTIIDGSASGRVLETAGNVTITGVTIQNGSHNPADIFGGAGIANYGVLRVEDSLITGNSTTSGGGGIFNNHQLTLVNSEVSGNSAGSVGGGIVNYSSDTITITNSLIANNDAAQGGGVYSIGQLIVNDSTVQGNMAEVIGGGVIIWGGTAVLNRTTLTENEAVQYGAGLLNNGGVFTLTNSTVSGNSAPDYVGVANIGSTVQGTILNSTIAFNIVTSAGTSHFGGVANFNGGTLTIQNSIVAQNSARQCIPNNNWTSAGNNLSSDNRCAFTATGDLQFTDPLLAPLGDYGGPTPTHALSPGSPAIDAGSNSACPATDQRGITRPVDGDNNATAVCDIGAFEARNQLTIADISVNEGDSGTTDAVFTVTLSPASSQTVTVDYATVAGTAVANNDYNTTSGQLTFTPGQTTRTIIVPVNGDTNDEADETFTVNLSSASNADIIDGVATGTIVDDDGLGSLTITDQTVTEGDVGTTIASFTVTLSPAAASTVTVNYATANGSASAGSDFGAASDQLTFAPGQTTQIIQVAVNGDNTDEGDSETFVVNLSNASGANIADSQGTGTITDDETAVISLSFGPQVAEGDSGTKTAVFTVTLTHPASFPITVDYATEDGFGDDGADAGSDYEAKSGTLTFNPGTDSLPINITIYGDETAEPDERLAIRISNGNPAPILASVAYGDILNDDNMKVYLPMIVR
ncbi:MAG: Calx-beta domain-containing protein [Candidatus Promineifilaceae bacterium]